MKNFHTALIALLLGIVLLNSVSCEKYILPAITLSQDTLAIACTTQQDIPVKVSSNVKWQVSISEGEGWIKFTPKVAVKGDSTILITVEANTDIESRQGKLNVTSETLSKSIVILQDGDI